MLILVVGFVSHSLGNLCLFSVRLLKTSPSCLSYFQLSEYTWPCLAHCGSIGSFSILSPQASSEATCATEQMLQAKPAAGLVNTGLLKKGSFNVTVAAASVQTHYRHAGGRMESGRHTIRAGGGNQIPLVSGAPFGLVGGGKGSAACV